MTAQLVAPDQQTHLRAVPDHRTDDAAFEALYAEHFDRLRRFVLGLTGHASLAEDVAQETLLRAYLRLDSIDLDRPLWPWLKCVAVRLVVDNSRVARRESLDPDPEVETATDTFDVTVERQLLSEALRCLPVRQRVALGLRYLENWKSAEVAAALGLSRVAVEQLLLRARRRLSAEYLALGGEGTGWRLALWPLLFVVSRLRDRTAKARQVLGGSAAQVSLTVEGATNMVAVVAMGSMFLAGGVALAAPAPQEAGREVRVVHASAFHAAGVRAVAVPAPRVATSPVVTAPRPAPAVRAGAASAETPAAPAAQQRVSEVRVEAPVTNAPASPTAGATRRRTADEAAVVGDARARIGESAPGTGVEVSIPCSNGEVMAAACAAYDAADQGASAP